MSEEIELQQIKEAWDRLARTRDGLVVYRHLQRIRLGLAPENVPDGALPRLEGRRSLAADLMAFMSEGIAENDRSCITFAVARPSPVSGASGTDARRKWLASQPWYDTPDTSPPGDAGSTNGSGSGTT